MRKIFSLVSAVSISCAFSFYKMCDVLVYEYVDDKTYIKLLNDQALNPEKKYRCVVYNPQLKYGFFKTYGKEENFLSQFELFKQRNFTPEWWEKYFIDEDIKKEPFTFFSNELPQITAFEKLDKEFEKNNPSSKYFGQHFFFSFNEIYMDTEKKYVEIRNTHEGIKVDHLTRKDINFEDIFKWYVQQHSSSYSDQLLQNVLTLEKEIKDENVQIPTLSAINNKSKMFYSQEEKDLLNRSKILAIWALPETYRHNENYANNEKRFKIKPEIRKDINHIIIGFAYDEKTKRTFHWVTDLGQDIRVMFDMYIKHLEEKEKETKNM